MSAIAFLTELSRQGVKVWVDGDQLRCRAPKGMITASLRSKLAEYKPELLTLLSQHQNNESIMSLPQVMLVPDQLCSPFPVTDVQQAYWIGRNSTFELGNVGNHGYIEVEAADLDMARSLSVLRKLIERHPMLRAVMLPDGQQQIFEQVPPFQVEFIDLEGLHPQDLTEQLEHIRHQMDHQVFDVEQWPSFAIRVSRLQEQCVRIHISMESLFLDAWSTRILLREFLHFYHESQASLPPLDLSFRDYLLAQIQLQESDLYRRSQDYWAQRLQDLPPAPDLPLAIDPASLQHPRFVPRKAQLDAEFWQQLKARGAQAGLTPSGILLAAFAEILTTWSKTPRFCINLTIFDRLPLHPQMNDIVGDFTSLLLLAVDNFHPETFKQRAKRLQEQLWRDLNHRYYSGVRVLRDLARMQGSYALAMMPVVFTSLLGQEIAPTYATPWQETIYWVTQTPQVWLDHQVLEEAGNLVLYWQAVEALFPAGLLDAMFEAYVHFLHRLATDDTLWQASSCELVPSSQLEIRARINATEAPVSNRLLQSFFVEQAIKRPDHLAVISPRRSLTYEELLRESTLLGHQLRQQGARPNHLVAVVMEKGWEQVVGVLGVLLSGAAYLPIDPKVPQERLTFLLDHGEVGIVVTQTWINETLQWPEQLTRLCVDELDLTKTDLEPLKSWQGPEDLAYVIYTSGSTGLPKGVMIDHRGAVNTILDINERFGVSSTDRVLALSAFNFDLSVYDIFGVLAAGGTIVMPAEDAWRNPAVWVDLLVHERVTLWNTVPALLEMLVEYTEAHAEALSSSCLRLALLSGDWIPVSLPDRLRRHIPEVEIISLGGATEASIWSILYPITAVDPSWKSIPYGKPMSNQRFFVLNERLDSCPVWVPGQLSIGGIGLAKGYWHDEEKTQASFFSHPSQIGERLYRTGDLGRYLPDGTIEFLGREDFQVKILGHRIELGEIEVVLGQHPQVGTAVVVVQKGESGEQQLVAYVVRKESGSELSSQALRSYLQGKLPEYMIPLHVVVLANLPLTPNGKVDRRTLPAPEVYETEARSVSIPGTRTPIEEILAAIWCEVLGRSQVGIYDNFFALGGQSLVAMRLIARIKETFRVEIPLFDLFGALTVAEMARCVEGVVRSSQAIEIPPLVPVQRAQNLPLSFAQQRLWFLNQLQPESTDYVFPIVWHLCGLLDTRAWERSLHELLHRHESLRTTFTERMGQPIQVIHPASRYVLPVIDLQGLKQEQRKGEAWRLAEQETQHCCDLINGPLVRASLLQLEEQEHVQLLIVHHIVADGWSGEILMHEIAALYQAEVNGEPSPLPPLPIQYADYALWQRQWLRGEVLQEQLDYWRQQLAGAPTVMNLPSDRPRSAAQPFVGAQQSLLISSDLLLQLKALGQKEGVTQFMTLLAAFYVLLHYYTDQDDLVVGTDVANRNQVGTEGLIGFFVNQLVLRTDLADNPSFLEVLHRVRKMSLEAYAHQDLPFERLVEELNPQRDLSRTPLFQVKFLLQDVPIQEPTFAKLIVKPVEFYRGTPEFDLILNMSESDHKLFGRLGYRTDLFNAESMTRFVGHFETVLYQIVAHPSVRLDELKAVLATADGEEQNTREQELRQVSLQKLGQVRSKPRRRVH